MRAIVFADGTSRLEERPLPEPGPGEALVRVLLAGICNTDLELLRGYYGFSGVAGHEFVGRVEACPADPSRVGRRVTADINCGCGACPACRAGDPRHCPERTVLGIAGRPGAFAEFLAAPLANLLDIPDGLPDEAAVFSEPLAAAVEPARQLALGPETRLLVLGDGKLGLLTALGLARVCPGLVLAGRHPRKLGIAAARGLRTVLAEAGRTPASLAEELGRFDVVVEATGSPDGVSLALALARPEGVVVAKTTSRHPSPIDLARLVVDEITLLGSRCGDQGAALGLLASGAVDPAPLVEAEHPFSGHAEAFARAASRGALKVLLRP